MIPKRDGDAHTADPKAIVILCTAPAEGEHAHRLARGLVEARLAACVNIIGNLRSIYRWDDAVQDDAEVQLVIKSRLERFEAIADWLAENHPYDVPEVLALPVIEGASSYLAWLSLQTSSAATSPT